MSVGVKKRNIKKATFAGGCFWCMVSPFESLPGVIKVVAGYTGGEKENPTYEEVCSGDTGHCEAVQITFDPELCPYERLLEVYRRQIDPTDHSDIHKNENGILILHHRRRTEEILSILENGRQNAFQVAS